MARGRASLAVIVAGVIAACGAGGAPSPARSPHRRRGHSYRKPDHHGRGSDSLTAEPQPSTDRLAEPGTHGSPSAAEANRRLV